MTHTEVKWNVLKCALCEGARLELGYDKNNSLIGIEKVQLHVISQRYLDILNKQQL